MPISRGTLRDTLKVGSNKKAGDVPTTQILKQGWLEKQGKSRFGGRLQRRYCELYMGAFVYFHGISGPERKSRGVLALNSESVVAQDQNKARVLKITPVPNARVYQFVTETEAECKDWVESVRNACSDETALDMRCPKGHNLFTSLSSGERKCGGCLSPMSTGALTVCCRVCEYDVCKTCFDAQSPKTDVRCPKDHMLACGRCTSSQWCGVCRTGIAVGSPIASCRACDYYVCKVCLSPKEEEEVVLNPEPVVLPTIGVFVKAFLRGEDQACVVVTASVYPKSPVEELMKIIQGTASLAFPIEEQTLMFGNVILSPGYTLEYYSIKAEDVILVIHRIPIIQASGSVTEILTLLQTGQLNLPDPVIGCVAWSDRKREHYHIYWNERQRTWANRAQPTLTATQKRDIASGAITAAPGSPSPLDAPRSPSMRPVQRSNVQETLPALSEHKQATAGPEQKIVAPPTTGYKLLSPGSPGAFSPPPAAESAELPFSYKPFVLPAGMQSWSTSSTSSSATSSATSSPSTPRRSGASRSPAPPSSRATTGSTAGAPVAPAPAPANRSVSPLPGQHSPPPSRNSPSLGTRTISATPRGSLPKNPRGSLPLACSSPRGSLPLTSPPLTGQSSGLSKPATGETDSGSNSPKSTSKSERFFDRSRDSTTDCNSPKCRVFKEDVDWRRGRELGVGATGKVYEAKDLRSGALIAVKQIKLTSTMTEIQARALEREIGTMVELTHPNIVQILGTEMRDNKIFIFMEYVPGHSLASQLKQFGAFTEDHARRYCGQLVDALAYCHNAGVVHRDLKGANILVTLAGSPKLADFGSARKLDAVDQKQSLSEDFTYTTEWTAPEVFNPGEFDSKVDIWSLGCVVVEMLTGKTPWAEHKFASREVAIYRIGTGTEIPVMPKGLSPEGQDFLLKCFQRDPTQRATAKDLLDHPWVLTND